MHTQEMRELFCPAGPRVFIRRGLRARYGKPLAKATNNKVFAGCCHDGSYFAKRERRADVSLYAKGNFWGKSRDCEGWSCKRVDPADEERHNDFLYPPRGRLRWNGTACRPPLEAGFALIWFVAAAVLEEAPRCPFRLVRSRRLPVRASSAVGRHQHTKFGGRCSWNRWKRGR